MVDRYKQSKLLGGEKLSLIWLLLQYFFMPLQERWIDSWIDNQFQQKER